MNKYEKVGLLMVTLTEANLLAYRIQDEYAPLYVVGFFILGCLLWLFGDDG